MVCVAARAAIRGFPDLEAGSSLVSVEPPHAHSYLHKSRNARFRRISPSPPDAGRRRGLGRGGAFCSDSPLSSSLPTRSSRGERELVQIPMPMLLDIPLKRKICRADVRSSFVPISSMVHIGTDRPILGVIGGVLPAHTPIAPPEPHRSLTVDNIVIYGEAPGKLRCGPPDGLVQGLEESMTRDWAV